MVEHGHLLIHRLDRKFQIIIYIKMKILNTKAILLFICTILFVACSKEYGYDFEDGVSPGGEKGDITVDTSMSTVDRSLYHRARIFPGLVDASEPRVTDLEIDLDLNYVPASRLRVNVTPNGIHSVGLYAPAGELIRVVVPEGVEGLTLQIGVHTDNLTGKTPLSRDPVIYTVKALYPGVNYLRNLYGGLIWVKSRQPVVGPPVKLVFTGAVHTADFILGESEDEEWKERLRETSVPWLELRSRHTVYTVQRDFLLNLIRKGRLNSPTAVMSEWNLVHEKDFYEWMGLTVGDPDPRHRAPDLPERGVLDIQISVGYGHSGYPWMAVMDEGWTSEWVDLSSVKGGGSWGSYHEVGHNYQQSNWSWDGLGETTNNLFIFRGAHRNGSFPTHPAVEEQFPLALAFAAQPGQKNFDTYSENPFFKLLPFVQLFNKANKAGGSDESGWGVMTALYTNTRNLDQYQLSNNIADQKDFVYETVSDYTEMDYARFFDAWGISITTQSKNKIKAKGYPKLAKEIWKYDPKTNTGGDTPIPTKFDYPRNTWTAKLSSQTADGPAVAAGFNSALFDGVLTSYWHSSYSPILPHPHHVLVDMKEALEVKGLFFTQRQGGSRNIKNVKVYISNTDIAADSQDWELLGNYTLLQNNSRQEIALPTHKTFRYVKLLFDEPGYDGSNFTCLAEFGTFYDD